MLHVRKLSQQTACCCRKIFVPIPIRTYFEESDRFGPSTVQFGSQLSSDRIFVKTFSVLGFTLRNGEKILGPCVFFPKSLMHWNVSLPGTLSKEAFSLFTLIDPKPDLIVIGTEGNINKDIKPYLLKNKLNTEILKVRDAVAVFNQLNEDGRYVVAALIPPHGVGSRMAILEKQRLTEKLLDTNAEIDSRHDVMKKIDKM